MPKEDKKAAVVAANRRGFPPRSSSGSSGETPSEAGARLEKQLASKALMSDFHPGDLRSPSGNASLRSIPSGESDASVAESEAVPLSTIQERINLFRASAPAAAASVAPVARINSASELPSILDRYPAAAAAAAAGEVLAQQKVEEGSKGSSFGGRRHKRRSRTHRKSKRHTKRSKKRRS